jgi:hypothetical protein
VEQTAAPGGGARAGFDFAQQAETGRSAKPTGTCLMITAPSNTLSWHPDGDVTPTPREVEAMAETLEGRHGQHAADVADFFSTQHSLSGDAGRCWAWAGVAESIRRRTAKRLKQS